MDAGGMPACCSRSTLGSTPERLERELKKLPREASDSVSHKPECADLRKKFPAYWRCLRHLGRANNVRAGMHRHPDAPSTTIAIEAYRAFRFAVRRSQWDDRVGIPTCRSRALHPVPSVTRRARVRSRRRKRNGEPATTDPLRRHRLPAGRQPVGLAQWSSSSISSA